VAVVLLLPAVLAAAVAYQALGEWLDRRRFPPPGRLYKVGKSRLHLRFYGDSSPASPLVLLESGIAASSLSWALVAPELARFARVCSYDRAGLGWSEPGSQPRTLDAMLMELSGLLAEAGISGPYILVGHSFGGLLIRAFAHMHPNDVAGLVFVDPVSLTHWADASPATLRRLEAGVKLSRRGAVLARLGIVRAALSLFASGSRRLPQWIARKSAGPGNQVLTRLIGELRRIPSGLHAVMRAHWSRPQSFRAMANHLACLPDSARAVLPLDVPANTPFVVLSAATATVAEIAERDSWLAGNPLGSHLQIADTGHWIQLEQPAAVVAAVRSCLYATS
jgi:pimeloyl-ACP methyl ester carboxylesterase